MGPKAAFIKTKSHTSGKLKLLEQDHLIGQRQGFRSISCKPEEKRMLNSKPTQFTLKEDGRIFWQSDASNPLPGEPVACIKKGDSPLRPLVEMKESELLTDSDRQVVRNFIQDWLKTHIADVLGPLVALGNEEGEKAAAVRGIAFQVHEAMGILPREKIEDLIADLDQDLRRVLRSKRIRLGPVLVFMPDLNKPAAVRLRGLLWSLYHDAELPARVPNDGIVSYKVEDKKMNPDFYRAIGYPLYGGRAIRIDMLDRVINAVYDAAEKGQFKARHEMAEWLGCPIEDLYNVLEAMGHKKIHDPALEAEKQDAEEKTITPQTVEKEKETEEQKSEQKKPELATFRLKKGKAYARSDAGGRKKNAGKRPKKSEKIKNRDKNKKKVMEAGPKPKPEDSPFAVLQQLKVKADGQ